ncbi:MAG: M1 family metallopeptidase [Bacteroidales bacterium]
MKTPAFLLALLSLGSALYGQGVNDPSNNKFRQMRTDFATPNAYRTASGAPGALYWQQQANYIMEVELDDDKQQLRGQEYIEYINHSPDVLSYLWVQLDQNVRQPNSLGSQISPGTLSEQVSSYQVRRLLQEFDGGFHLEHVRDRQGNDLSHVVNYTMMRIDLPQPLKPGEKTVLDIAWWYNINDRMKDGGGRSGMEYFEEDGNYIYTLAQFYPRMAVYSDFEGWQNNQFLGRTEFALPFGNFRVSITVPSDHVVGATGDLENAEDVLTEAQFQRYLSARENLEDPEFIVTPQEAASAEKHKAKGKKTWNFRAENVRDFAFASSRKFMWDAMGVAFGDRTVMATSLYSKEGNPLWEQYSTRVVAHTLQVYSRHTFDYPYPVAYSVHTDNIGMEYPMICFNGGRPRPDGTYSERTKWGMIGVIIHEVGHNYFPMIVNSDERQWTWMDEGLNTFLQGIAEREWDHDHPSPKGKPASIVPYMKGDPAGIAPIMINGELTMDFSNNAYHKPATALNILRETVMGRELFDFAFKEYARRWMFKHPTPEDLFRTLEDASAVDLDWFWRGWFYTVDHVDISLDGVTEYRPSPGDPSENKALQKTIDRETPEEIAVQRNRTTLTSAVESNPKLLDRYDRDDPYAASEEEKAAYESYRNSLTADEKELIDWGGYYYQLDFTNVGGLVMPLILEFRFADGRREIQRIPAQIWSRDNVHTSKVFFFPDRVASVVLDPNQETADCDLGNNQWPPKMEENRFEIYKRTSGSARR